MSKKILIKDIGSVKITRKKGVRRMTLSVKPFSGINVTIPHSFSFKKAESFVLEKKNWIIKAQKKVSATENTRTLFTPKTTFSTKKHELVFVPSMQTKIYIIHGKILVEYTNEKSLLLPENQDYIRKGIIEALRIEAKEYLPKRTEYLAKKHGFKYGKVTVRNAKTRWGSCSGKNNISLNVHLMRKEFLDIA